MKHNWLITYGERSCEPQLVLAQEQQDKPRIILTHNDVEFSVVFDNRSDYISARHGTIAEVLIISPKQMNRFLGTAVNNPLTQ